MNFFVYIRFMIIDIIKLFALLTKSY